MARAQMDLFETQGDMFPSAPVVYRADAEKVRVELLKILAEARGAESMPWDRKQRAYYATVFPQMTNWLPDTEAAQLKLAFVTELERLEG